MSFPRGWVKSIFLLLFSDSWHWDFLEDIVILDTCICSIQIIKIIIVIQYIVLLDNVLFAIVTVHLQ